MKLRTILLLIATILMMAAIFWFSAQPAEESTEMSNGIGYLIGKTFVPHFEELDAAEQSAYVSSIDHTVRKCAHASEYLLLGVLLTATLLSFRFPDRSYYRTSGRNHVFYYVLGFCITVLYAVTDEIHQIFVPGRACMFTDMLIDASGAAFGILVLFLFRFCSHFFIMI